ncbi:hypothetical protein AQUCO_05700005v1 [Aquilegia coerulea]|uniref:Uncharacterized protein n=1 Tax=Aquilegia coerulea TaxID=218851 RepID=A0A2G5CFD7_AQUCA|nr:hypothetical protein AQUCO_05700005v1 [Aquilegia coerulea]
MDESNHLASICGDKTGIRGIQPPSSIFFPIMFLCIVACKTFLLDCACLSALLLLLCLLYELGGDESCIDMTKFVTDQFHRHFVNLSPMVTKNLLTSFI